MREEKEMTEEFGIKWYDKYEDIPPGEIVEHRDDIFFREVRRRGVFLYDIGRDGRSLSYHETGPFWDFEYLKEKLIGRTIASIEKLVSEHSRKIQITFDDGSTIDIWDSEQYEIPFGMAVNGIEVV